MRIREVHIFLLLLWMGKFPCTMCGLCCHKVSTAIEMFKMLQPGYEFPYGWDETGKCDQLGGDNRCQVYENRPMMCNIDAVCEYYGLEKQEFYQFNIAACNKMMDEEEIDEKFRIVL